MSERRNPEMTWTFEAGAAGPTAAIVGGVHGNELAGIAAVHALRSAFASGEARLARGRLLLAIGNPRAVAAGRRCAEADLNRCFTAAALGGAGVSYEHARARELARFFDDVAFGVDVHGTNVPTEPFIVVQRAARGDDGALLDRLSAGIVLRDPDLVFAGETATLDEHFARAGGLGVCYETGAAGDTAVVGRIAGELMAALASGGWTASPVAGTRPCPKKEFVLCDRIVASPGFAFSDGVGVRNFMPLRRGDPIGADGPRKIAAPYDCLLAFPKPSAFRTPGEPVGYLAVEA